MLNTNQNTATPWYNTLPPQERLDFFQMDKEIARLRKEMDSKITSFFKSELGKKDKDFSLVVQSNKPTKMGVELYESCTPSESYKKCKKSYDEKVKISEYYRLYALHKDEIYKIIKKNRVYGLCLKDKSHLFENLMSGFLYDKYKIKPKYVEILNTIKIIAMNNDLEHFYGVAENYLYKQSAIDLFSQLKADVNDFAEFYRYTEENTLLFGVQGCNFVCRIWGSNNKFHLFVCSKDFLCGVDIIVNAESINFFSCNSPYTFNLLNFGEFIEESMMKEVCHQFLYIGTLAYKNMRQKRCVYEFVDGMKDTTPKNNKSDVIGDSEEPIIRHVHVLRDDEVKYSKITVGRKGVCKDRMYCTPQWPRKAFIRVRYGKEEHIAATTCHRKGEVHERPKLFIFS